MWVKIRKNGKLMQLRDDKAKLFIKAKIADAADAPAEQAPVHGKALVYQTKVDIPAMTNTAAVPGITIYPVQQAQPREVEPEEKPKRQYRRRVLSDPPLADDESIVK